MPVPQVLLSPPWESAKRTKKGAQGPRLQAPPIADTIVWGPKGRTYVPWGSKEQQSAALDAEVEREAARGPISYVRLFDATNDTMIAILHRDPVPLSHPAEGLAHLLSRVGQPAIKHVLARFRDKPTEALPYVLALRSALIAPTAAEAWHRRKQLKLDGGRWLVRHPEVAALVLLPIVAGKAGKARDDALAALSLLEKEEPAAFATALDYYGEDARAVWSSAREEAPATGAPTKAPPVPTFLGQVTAPVLVSGEVLPHAALCNLCGLLALAPHPEPAPELGEIRKACTEESLATFARTLLTGWMSVGTPREHGYIVRAAVHLGDDALVAELAGHAEEWGSNAGYARAVWIAEALAVRGSTLALGELDHLARRARSWSLRLHASGLLNGVAEARGIAREELSDRLVPELGIGKPWGESGHVLDLDGERLVLVAPNGARLAEPTETNARPAFRALAKEARTVLSRVRSRFESAMLDGRTWTAASFAMMGAHPVLGRIARRLVWVMTDQGTAHALRLAEDGSLADVNDNASGPVRDSSTFHIAHPVELGLALSRWRAIMHDYELIEPFAQVAREAFVSGTDALLPLSAVAADRLAGVARRGWVADGVEDGGRIMSLSRSIRGTTATLALEPGLHVGGWSSSEPQDVTPSLARPPLDCPVLFSEVVRDLREMTT
ncbi:hypothetical protein BH11MYX4_BH11MYX4_22220 [soil metagenome]